MYQYPIKLPSIWTEDVRVVHPRAAQTIPLGVGSLCWYRMQAGDLRSSLSLQTRICPSEYCMQIRNSSVKTTLCHPCIQFHPSAHQNRYFSLCCIVKESKSNDRWAHCSKYWHNVRSVTRRTVNMHNFGVMVNDVVIRFCRADFTICLSSRT